MFCCCLRFKVAGFRAPTKGHLGLFLGPRCYNQRKRPMFWAFSGSLAHFSSHAPGDDFAGEALRELIELGIWSKTSRASQVPSSFMIIIIIIIIKQAFCNHLKHGCCAWDDQNLPNATSSLVGPSFMRGKPTILGDRPQKCT